MSPAAIITKPMAVMDGLLLPSLTLHGTWDQPCNPSSLLPIIMGSGSGCSSAYFVPTSLPVLWFGFLK